MGFFKDIKIKTDFSFFLIQNGFSKRSADAITKRYLEAIRLGSDLKTPTHITAWLILHIVQTSVVEHKSSLSEFATYKNVSMRDQIVALSEMLTEYSQMPNSIGTQPSFRPEDIPSLLQYEHLMD